VLLEGRRSPLPSSYLSYESGDGMRVDRRRVGFVVEDLGFRVSTYSLAEVHPETTKIDHTTPMPHTSSSSLLSLQVLEVPCALS